MVVMADIEIYEINGVKYIDYGAYPQTHVGEEELIAKLNQLTEVNDRGYYEYMDMEFVKLITSPYQSNSTTDSVIYYKYIDGKVVQKDTVEWFVVEPIRWRVVSKNLDGSYQIYSEYILDATSFFNGDYIRNVDGVDVYRNNYQYSNIRVWMNGYDGTNYGVDDYKTRGFYDVAFNDVEKNSIILTEVDNGGNTTASLSNPYACTNTCDKVYLLSFQDLKNANYGFADDLSRYGKVTDYAKVIGAYWDVSDQYSDNDLYWLRSPSAIDKNEVCFVNYDGNVLNYYAIKKHYGVRVACNIFLD